MSHLPPLATPKTRLSISHGHFTHPRQHYASMIRTHPLNQQTEIYVPLTVANEVEEALKLLDGVCYRVELPLVWFIGAEFSREYLKKGNRLSFGGDGRKLGKVN